MTFYHLSGAQLAFGSVIDPGNWGRVVRAWGWRHGQTLREMALEDARIARFPTRPSRLDSAFVFLTIDEARNFRARSDGFLQHILYRVTLVDPGAASHVTDSRLCTPHGDLRSNWADVYWIDYPVQAAAVPGIDWAAQIRAMELREMLTLSQLRIEERLN
jgi:hypothetical protein